MDLVSIFFSVPHIFQGVEKVWRISEKNVKSTKIYILTSPAESYSYPSQAEGMPAVDCALSNKSLNNFVSSISYQIVRFL